jgi:hypothetical protein
VKLFADDTILSMFKKVILQLNEWCTDCTKFCTVGTHLLN